MKIAHYLVSAAAALLLVAPSIVGAQTTASDNPIAIQSFHVYNGEYTLLTTGEMSNEANSIDIVFQNTSSNPATTVVFSILSGGQEVGQITDVGQFAAQATIARHYENTFDSVAPLTDASVVPVEVDFANGQIWTAPIAEQPAN